MARHVRCTVICPGNVSHRASARATVRESRVAPALTTTSVTTTQFRIIDLGWWAAAGAVILLDRGWWAAQKPPQGNMGEVRHAASYRKGSYKFTSCALCSHKCRWSDSS
jgi:hypothetical protein